MKKILFSISFIAFVSCATPKFYYHMGQSENDFLNVNRKNVAVDMFTIDTHVYRTKHPRLKTFFFYFVNGKLVRVDQGVRESDIIIENN